MKTTSYAQTNIGAVRANNEDNYYCNGSYKQNAQSPVEELVSAPEGDGLLFGVFDGMGGEARGEDAAFACAQTLAAFQSRDMQYEAPAYFERANAAVRALGAADETIGGSTAAVAYLRGNRLFACNAGDSRIYFCRAGALRCLSRDHTKYQQQIDDGFAQPLPPGTDCRDRHVLTQYVGMRGRLTPHFAVSLRLEPGDRVLLCSDGLTGRLADEAIAAVLGQNLPLEQLGRQLVSAALEAGARDNITVVLVEIAALDAETLPDDPPPRAPELTQTRRFEVPPAAKIAAQQEAQRRRQKQELRREIWMVVLVTLAVLLVVGSILYISLGRMLRQPTPPPETTATATSEVSAAPTQPASTLAPLPTDPPSLPTPTPPEPTPDAQPDAETQEQVQENSDA